MGYVLSGLMTTLAVVCLWASHEVTNPQWQLIFATELKYIAIVMSVLAIFLALLFLKIEIEEKKRKGAASPLISNPRMESA